MWVCFLLKFELLRLATCDSAGVSVCLPAFPSFAEYDIRCVVFRVLALPVLVAVLGFCACGAYRPVPCLSSLLSRHTPEIPQRFLW